MRSITLAALLVAPLMVAQSMTGRWDATVRVGGLDIPFRFEVSGQGRNLQGAFFNGEEKDISTGGSLENGKLVLRWDHLEGRLEAVLKDGALDGAWIGPAGPKDRGAHAFHAVRWSGPRKADPNAPSIGGLWIIPTNSSKGEAAWRFIVEQNGADVTAAILRVDGDTGAITGGYENGKFVLSHFSGLRPNLMEITVMADGSLDIVQNRKSHLSAVRAEKAQAMGLPLPADPTKHTGVKDASEPFQFSFANLDGKMVSNSDEKFKGKAVLVEITGSWCPNCHDEAPFLTELYRTYHAKGLEIVALGFEEADQLKNPVRPRAFVKQFGIEYPFLLVGEPEEAAAKISQAENLNAFPTTFVLGRDGRVRTVHAGFASPATGAIYGESKKEMKEEVERLLAEKAPTTH